MTFRLAAKIDQWVDADLLSEEQAERIRAYEGESNRPLLLWALTGLGALAILLGTASLVAANWEDIPGLLRLTVHLGIIAATAVAHFLLDNRAQKPGDHWFADARLWLIGGLGLAFLFHLEQVYDRDFPLWQLMLVWLIGFSPLLLGRGATVSVAIGWMAGLITFCLAIIAQRADLLGDLNLLDWGEGVFWAVMLALPCLAGLIALVSDRNSAGKRGDFWSQIAGIGFYWQFAIANYFYLWGRAFWPEGNQGLIELCLPLAAIILMLSAVSARFTDRVEARTMIGMTAICAALLLLAPYRPAEAPGALIFIIAWAVIALLSLEPGWRPIFQGAVAIIALRLVILTFELSDNLLGSGIGFILAGIALFVFASIAIRVGRGYAPDERKKDMS